MKHRWLWLALLVVVVAPAAVLARVQNDGQRTLVLVPSSGPLKGKEIYRRSHALLVGINQYPRLPKERWLEYTHNDVLKLRETLIRSYGFPAANVTVLLDSDATKARIESALASLADDRKVEDGDRVLVYFSCHGQTVKRPSGQETGFLIPYDAAVDLDRPQNAGPYLASCIPMDTVWSYLEASQARHALVLVDACYGGLMARSRALEPLRESVLARVAATRDLRVITAGSKGEASVENPRWGHGAFTYKLLQELNANVEPSGSVLLASDLYSLLKRSVGNLTDGRQTPQMATRETEGDFLFISTAPQPVSPAGAIRPAAAGAPAASGPLPRAKAGGTPEEARALLKLFTVPGADLVKLTQALKPTAEDYNAVFLPEHVAPIRAYMDRAWVGGGFVAPNEGQTDIRLRWASSEQVKNWTSEASENLPGGYQNAGKAFRDGFQLYAFAFVKPGELLGMAYDILVCVNGNWRLFHKVHRVFR